MSNNNKHNLTSSPYSELSHINSKDLSKLSTQQLKSLLSTLQTRHQSLQTKNEQLSNQAQDLRKVIKCVQKESKQEIECLLKKKKKLQEEVDRIEKDLTVMNKSDNYKTMMAYKEVMGE